MSQEPSPKDSIFVVLELLPGEADFELKEVEANVHVVVAEHVRLRQLGSLKRWFSLGFPLGVQVTGDRRPRKWGKLGTADGALCGSMRTASRAFCGSPRTADRDCMGHCGPQAY